MKLAEAAQVLGISLEDVTLHSLKDTYVNLTMSWDPEKSKDPLAKQKYIQITEAYKKLNSVMEGKDSFRGDDQHEIAAFMRMFMDMVGMSESDSLPTAAMTFGMMFGSQQNNMDEWSTDEDPDADYDDDEDDEDDDYLPDEYYDELGNPTGVDKALWEPQVKQYSNMNLKDQVSKAREGDAKQDEVKKQRLAKKRAEKRKKQKEKKQCTTKGQGDDSEFPDQASSSGKKFDEVIPPESLDKIVAHHKQRLVEEMLSSIEEGRADSAERILSFNFQGEMPSSIIELVSSAVKENFASQYLLHRCITDFSKLPVNTPADILEKARLLQTKRIEIASKLLKLKDPFLELHVSDDSGLSILHQSINCGDLAFAALVMDTITDTSSERKTSLNLNSRCHKKGWAPIHYAVEKLNIEAIKLLSQKGANLQATSATDKRLTPVELAKTKSKASNVSNATKELIQRCIQELTEQIALQKKIQKEAEKASSKVSHPEKSVPTSSVPTKTEANSSSSKTVAPVAVDTNKTAPLPLVEETSSSKSDKKKKKQEAKGKSDPSDAKVPSVPVVIQPTTASSSSSAVASSSTKKQTPSKGNKASQQPSIVPAHEMSVASRDEMVDRLLAMGFKESDCLAAIALYGTDIDQAISWLVEKPTRTNVPEPKPRANKEDTTKAATPEVTTTPAKSSSSESSNKSPEGETALSLQQKREELRRINREWNAKTEDEKRKLEQQKRLAEEAKAKELAQKETNTPAKAPKSEETPNSKAGKQAKHGASGSKNKQKDNHAHSSSHGNVWQSPANKNNGGAFSGNNAGYGNSPFSAGYGYPPVPPGQEVYYPTMPMNQGMGYGSSNSAYSYDQSGNKGYGYNGYDESTNNAEDIYINGALELSAVAKPFVPKTFTPATLPTPATSSSTPTMDQSTSMPPLAPSNLSSGFPTSILPHMDLPSALSNNTSSSFLKGLGSSTNSLTGLEGNNMLGVGSNLWSTSGVGLSGGAGGSSLDPFGSLGGQSFLSNILGKDLGLDVNDSFEFDAGHDLIPDIDSLLGNIPDFK